MYRDSIINTDSRINTDSIINRESIMYTDSIINRDSIMYRGSHWDRDSDWGGGSDSDWDWGWGSDSDSDSDWGSDWGWGSDSGKRKTVPFGSVSKLITAKRCHLDTFRREIRAEWERFEANHWNSMVEVRFQIVGVSLRCQIPPQIGPISKICTRFQESTTDRFVNSSRFANCNRWYASQIHLLFGT